MSLPETDGYFVEQKGGERRPAPLFDRGSLLPRPFGLVPVVRRTAVVPDPPHRPAQHRGILLRDYAPSSAGWKKPSPCADAAWERREWAGRHAALGMAEDSPSLLAHLAHVANDKGETLFEALFFAAQRLFWWCHGRVYVHAGGGAPCVPLRIFCTFPDLDYSWRGPDEIRDPEIDLAQDTVVDMLWRLFLQMARAHPWMHAQLLIPAQRFCNNVVRNHDVMLQSRNWKTVPVDGLRELHNARVGEYHDGLPVKVAFKAMGARTCAPSLQRQRVKSTGLPGSVKSALPRLCPTFVTHVAMQDAEGWALDGLPAGFPFPHAQSVTRDRLAALYSLAWDLAWFMNARTRQTVSRALDALSQKVLGRRAPFPYRRSLINLTASLDCALYPQVATRFGALDNLRYCHFVATGGLVVVDRLADVLPASTQALLRLPADQRVWAPPLRLLSAAGSEDAADNNACATPERTPTLKRPREEPAEQRVCLDLAVTGGWLSEETATALVLRFLDADVPQAFARAAQWLHEFVRARKLPTPVLPPHASPDTHPVTTRLLDALPRPLDIEALAILLTGAQPDAEPEESSPRPDSSS